MGKLKKEKHNHKLTDFLKVGIFSLVMLAPFISVGSKMAYVALNKNAKDSYYGETINETEYTVIDNLKTDLIVGKTYYLSKNLYVNNFTANTGSYSYGIQVENVKVINTNITITEEQINSIFQISPYYNTVYGNSVDIMLAYDGGSSLVSYTSTSYIELTFVYLGNNLNNNWEDSNFIYEIHYNDYSYLDNSFEYAVNQIGETPIFAWTKNTAIYTPIETMTNGLGFNPDNNTLAILLTYWSLVTAVYVIMDIVLFCFTKLTHFTQD